MAYMLKVSLDICINYIIDAFSYHADAHLFHCHIEAPVWAEAIHVHLKFQFIYCFLTAYT